MVLLLLLVVCIIAVGDAVVYSWPAAIPRIYWALLDPVVHVLLSVAIVSPLLAHPAVAGHWLRWLLVAAAVAVLIDLDHFIAAGSLDLRAVLSLGGRPPSHSLLFGVGCGVIVWLLTRNAVAAIIVFASLASHVIRDASHYSAPLLWPLYNETALSIPSYYAAQVFLCFLAALVAGWPEYPLWTNLVVDHILQLWRKASS